MKIVKCTAEMVHEVSEIERKCFSDPWSYASLEYEAEAGRILCAYENGVCGYIVSWSVLGECEIANIAVAPEYRRQGIAGMLLDFVMRESGMQYFLEAREGNAAARALYEKHGFSEYGRRKNYYKYPTEDAILYKC